VRKVIIGRFGGDLTTRERIVIMAIGSVSFDLRVGMLSRTTSETVKNYRQCASWTSLSLASVLSALVIICVLGPFIGAGVIQIVPP
jgi:hypothetical protein